MTPLNRESAGDLGGPLAVRVEYHEELASTQARARELAREGPGAPHGTLVLAGRQTGGRGRRGRYWESPRGGLWMSLVLRPELPAALAPRVTQAAAVAVARALRIYGVDAGIKWPNDVLVRCRWKVCGILAESSLRGGALEFVILGVGLNANLAPGDLTPHADGGTTTLRAELGRDVDLLRLLNDLLRELHRTLARLHHGFDAVLAERQALECTLGEIVLVRRDAGTLEGRVAGLTPEGALVLETQEGRAELFEGEVERLRRHR